LICRDFAVNNCQAKLLFSFLLVAFWIAPAGAIFAQGTKADYERARTLRERTRGKVFKSSVTPHWFDDNNRFWYRNDLADDKREFIVVDAREGKRGAAFDHAALAEALAKATAKPHDAEKLPIERIFFAGTAIHFRATDKTWKFEPESNALSEAELPPEAKAGEGDPPQRGRGFRGRRGGGGGAGGGRRGSPRRASSPDGRWTVEIKNDNVVLRDTKSGEETPLTKDGTAEHRYQQGVVWSPDSKRFVAIKHKSGGDRKVYLIESSPRDQLQPKLSSYDYLKPGDEIPQDKPHLFDPEAKKEIPVSEELFKNPWSITDLRWQPNSRRFTFVYNQRGHQVLRVVVVNAETGEAAALIDDQSDTFIDYAHKQFAHYADKTNEIIWMSERDGWNHLYLYDSRTGQVKNQITKGEWIVRGVDRVDEDNREIWFRAGGIYPEQDPYYIHYCRVKFDGTGLVVLTAGNGTHEIDYSPDRRFFIDTYSRVDFAPVHELRKTDDGSLVCEVERADWGALLATGWRPPERFVAKGRDGETDIYGVIYRPTNFDENKKYPVIEAIYAGPQGSFVPKRFGEYYGPRSLAELGFILVQIDGMGTSNRSKKFHDVCAKNLGDAGFPDRILWMKVAAEKYPCMDLTRVGVYGGSAGGQNSLRAMLAHGDFYKAAASDCGCHDNRMDKIWWNELWMGWPIGKHYDEQSNVTNAHKLQGKLLLTVGELDRNVDPASTMQVANALIRADKDFELVVIPGGGHGSGSGPYGTRRRNDFFVRNLLNVEPRRE
jgi:dipeptidyl aminopeptidase/acylaminoacyl peptidase